MKKTVKKGLAFTLFLAAATGFTSPVNAEASCSVTIDANKHTGSNFAWGTGVCAEYVQGIYAPISKQFNITGIYTDNVAQNGQQFSIHIPTVEGKTLLTVYTIQPTAAAPTPAPSPAPAPKQGSKPAPTPAPKQESKPAPTPAPKQESKPTSAPVPVQKIESKQPSTTVAADSEKSSEPINVAVADSKEETAEKETSSEESVDETKEGEKEQEKTLQTSTKKETEVKKPEVKVVDTDTDVIHQTTEKETDFQGIAYLFLTLVLIGGLGFGGYTIYRNRKK